MNKPEVKVYKDPFTGELRVGNASELNLWKLKDLGFTEKDFDELYETETYYTGRTTYEVDNDGNTVVSYYRREFKLEYDEAGNRLEKKPLIDFTEDDLYETRVFGYED